MPKRGNNIYKRKDGRWEARYVKGISADGKKLYGSVYGRTYTEAKDKQSLFIHDHLTTHKLNSISLSSLMHEWLNQIENTVKRSTYQKYCSIVKNHIDTHIIGALPVRYLTSKSYSDYSKSKLDSGILSSKTVNDILIVIGLSLSYSIVRYRKAYRLCLSLRRDNRQGRATIHGRERRHRAFWSD